ncbi:MAG TPA: UbiA family prenyltransferase, partial [Anaerolineales bacterium]
AWWMAVPPGLIITAILVVNNLRDLENDLKGGKHTLAVRLGEQGTKIEYFACMLGAYLFLLLAVWLQVLPRFALVALGSIPLGIEAAYIVRTKTGRSLNAALSITGQTALLFSVLFWVGLALAR